MIATSARPQQPADGHHRSGPGLYAARQRSDLLARIDSDAGLAQAHAWICRQRREYSPNSDVWDLRWRWDEFRPRLQREILAGTFRFGAVRHRCLRGELIERWSAEDAIVLKALARWKLRKAIQRVHRTMAELGLSLQPDKTFVGRTKRGFDFLGCRMGGARVEVARTAVARMAERVTRLYEQGASQRRIGDYVRRWLGWVNGGWMSGNEKDHGGFRRNGRFWPGRRRTDRRVGDGASAPSRVALLMNCRGL